MDEEHSQSEEQGIEQILRRLKELEKRISRLENNEIVTGLPVIDQHSDSKENSDTVTVINNQSDQPVAPTPSIDYRVRATSGSPLHVPSDEAENRGIESKIGEFGMAWLGNIVLFFGIVFLIQLFNNQGHVLLSSVFGFTSVAIVYLVSLIIRRSYPYMSSLFNYNGHLLLFIVTLKLHFTTPDPLISNKYIGLLLLLIVIYKLIQRSYQKQSQALMGIILIMIAVTAIISDSTPVMLSLMIFMAALSVYTVIRYDWWTLLIVSIIIVYTIFLLWSFNNPFVTHIFKAIESTQNGYIYLLICAFIFSMLNLLPEGDRMQEQSLYASVILNGLGFSIIIAILIVIFFKDNYYFPLGLVSAFSICYAAILQSRGVWKFSAALYVLYGFAVLSITIAGIYKFPFAFLLLSIQSLLVVSMALWFRSKFMVSMNVLMFISLLIAYLALSKPVSSIDYSFMLVAFLTASIINRQKDKLEIKTELMRNTYLMIGFIMTLVSLFRSVPDNYITLSWTLAAGIFFLLSILLRNVKYRWIAISTMIVSAFYFFMFDLRLISTEFRIAALLFLAIIALSLSTFYAKRMKSERDKHELSDQ